MGLSGVIAMPGFGDTGIVFDATSASAYKRHNGGVDTRAILAEVGQPMMVGGLEDMIVDIALDMVKRKETADG